MEEETLQKTHGSNEHDHCVAAEKEETPKRHPACGKRGGQKGVGWTVWLLIVLWRLPSTPPVGRAASICRACSADMPERIVRSRRSGR